MVKQDQINKQTETQEATAAAGGASTGAFSGPFMNPIKREMPEGLNLQKKQIPQYATLMYRDGANYKTFFHVPLTPEIYNQLEFNDDGTIEQEFNIEDFGISAEEMWDLAGQYDEEYDHNLVDVIDVTDNPEYSILGDGLQEGLNLPKKEIDEIPIYDAETNEELTRVNPKILDALWEDNWVFNDGKHWVTDMGWDNLSNILVGLKDLNEGLNLPKKQEPEPLNWHQTYDALYNLGFDEEGLEEVCNHYGVSTIQANGNGSIDYSFTLEELTDYFQQHPDEFREFMENIQNMDNTDQIVHEEMVNLYDEKKGIKITNQDLETELDEGTDIASVGAGGHGSGFAYIDPYGKGYHKEKNWGTWAKNEESMRWNQKPYWPGGSFVTVKKKCQKFPYCNQGDTGALNFSNPKVAKSHALSEGLNLPKRAGIQYTVSVLVEESDMSQEDGVYEYIFDETVPAPTQDLWELKKLCDTSLRNVRNDFEVINVEDTNEVMTYSIWITIMNGDQPINPDNNEEQYYESSIPYGFIDKSAAIDHANLILQKFKDLRNKKLNEGLNIPKKPQPKQYGTAIYASEDIDIPVKYVNNYVLEKLQNHDKIFRVSDAWVTDMTKKEFLKYLKHMNWHLDENKDIYNKNKVMGTAHRLKEYENKLFKGLLKENVLGLQSDMGGIIGGDRRPMDELDTEMATDTGVMDMDAHSIALELKDKLPPYPTEMDVFDGLCDVGYCGKDSGLMFDQVMSELVNMGIDINLSEGRKKKEKWIQKATKGIEKKGTEGKCTPITKPGCTGKAKTLAKTFKKMAKEKDESVETEKEKKSKSKLKEGTPGITMYNKIHGESGTSNKSGVKASMDNAKRLNKVADKTENEKLSGIGKGEPKYANFDKEKTEEMNELTDMLRGMGQQDLNFDTPPSEDYKKRAEEAIVGSSKMGNNPDWANAQRDFDGTKGELGKKIIDTAKKKKELMDKGNKKERYALNIQYPPKQEQEINLAMNEEKKLQNLKTKKVIYFQKDLDNLIPESHKKEGAQFKLFDGNNTVYELKWERGALVVESEKNQKLVESERNLFKKMSGYSVGQYKVKPKGYLTEEK